MPKTPRTWNNLKKLNLICAVCVWGVIDQAPAPLRDTLNKVNGNNAVERIVAARKKGVKEGTEMVKRESAGVGIRNHGTGYTKQGAEIADGGSWSNLLIQLALEAEHLLVATERRDLSSI